MSAHPLPRKRGPGLITPSPALRRAVLAAAALALLAACDKPEGEAERAGQKIDQAAEKAGEHINQAADQVGKTLERAGENLRDAAHNPASAPVSQAPQR